jgi:hypothetical protein
MAILGMTPPRCRQVRLKLFDYNWRDFRLFKSKYEQNFKRENTTTMAKVVAMPPGIGQ